jgi:hypothetical protein
VAAPNPNEVFAFPGVFNWVVIAKEACDPKFHALDRLAFFKLSMVTNRIGKIIVNVPIWWFTAPTIRVLSKRKAVYI